MARNKFQVGHTNLVEALRERFGRGHYVGTFLRIDDAAVIGLGDHDAAPDASRVTDARTCNPGTATAVAVLGTNRRQTRGDR